MLTIDPAKRLADSLGLPELGNEERQVDPGAVRRRRRRDQRRRAVGDDARRQGDLRRARAPPRSRRGDAGSHPLQPHLPAALGGAGGLAGVHGDGEAVRAPRRGPLRPAGPRHAADPQRARLPRGSAAPDAVHRGARASGLHAAHRVRDEGVRSRYVGDVLGPAPGHRRRGARGPVGVLPGLQRHGRAAFASAPSASTSCSPTRRPASWSSAGRRASRSARRSTSTASWSRRGCRSAA